MKKDGDKIYSKLIINYNISFNHCSKLNSACYTTCIIYIFILFVKYLLLCDKTHVY